VVLCVEEKPQLQAVERTAPALPVRPGSAERATFDYLRHGTTTLFAALEVATGRVTDACTDRHRPQEFLAFLTQVAAAYPRRRLHVVVDNYATHEHPAARAWLTHHPRITRHFTPTSGSWLNLVEAFFSIIIRQALRRGDFPTVADLIAAIEHSIDAWNDRCAPFTWTKDSDTVVAKGTDPRRRKTPNPAAMRYHLSIHRTAQQGRLNPAPPERLPDASGSSWCVRTGGCLFGEPWPRSASPCMSTCTRAIVTTRRFSKV
jgi:transposase